MRKSLLVTVLLLVTLLTVSLGCKAPASFEVVSLDITPPETIAGTAVSIIAKVKNTGVSEGTYTATLTLDGVKVETKDIVVAPGATETVNFSLAKDKAGTYTLAVGELSSSLTLKQKLMAKEVELKYDSNKARDALSGRGGHIVDFSPPTTPFTIKTIKIAGILSTRADKGVENNTFDLQILDKNLKVIYTVTYPYSRFSSAAIAWVNFEIPDVEVNDNFNVHIYTQSPRWGLHIGADDSVLNEHSDATTKDSAGNILILAQWPFGSASENWFGDKSKVNWMIRVVGTVMVPQE